MDLWWGSHSLPLWLGDGALSNTDTKHEGAGREGKGPQMWWWWCAAWWLQHSPAPETTRALYSRCLLHKSRTGTDSDELQEEVVAILVSFSTSTPVLASPVLPIEVPRPPQPLLQYLCTYSDFISPHSPHHHSGSSCLVAHHVWYSLSPCSICSI